MLTYHRFDAASPVLPNFHGDRAGDAARGGSGQW
jgi:hypothetical protein